jgi:OOP family OmpA-OmpF porin
MYPRSATVLLVACSLAGCAGTATAGDFFVGAGAGRSQVRFDAVSDFRGTDTSFRVFGGYEFMRYLAVEAAYADGGSPDDEVVGLDFQVNSDVVSAAVLGILPLGERFSLFARVGYAYYDFEFSARGLRPVDESGEKLLYGLGAEMGIGDHFRIRAEYERLEIYEGSADTADFATVSALFKFAL